MRIRANKKNLQKYAKQLLGIYHTRFTEAALIGVALVEPEYNAHCHDSHARAEHLAALDEILHTHGVEGMLLDKHGNDVSSTCDESRVHLDIQYCNTGDTYGISLMYVNGKLCIGDWGSLVECLS